MLLKDKATNNFYMSETSNPDNYSRTISAEISNTVPFYSYL